MLLQFYHNRICHYSVLFLGTIKDPKLLLLVNYEHTYTISVNRFEICVEFHCVLAPLQERFIYVHVCHEDSTKYRFLLHITFTKM
jgi:hypothetical protein